jgi:hypothetical protein
MSYLALVALLLFQYPNQYPGQYPSQYPGRTRQPTSPNLPVTNTSAVATFTGAFKSADKKYLFLELEEGNTMRMYITGSTKFIRDDKPAKASDFHTGEKVTVDAASDLRLNLLVVRVAAVPIKAAAKPPEPTPDKQPPAPQ